MYSNRGHPFPRGDSHDFPLEKGLSFSYILKLQNLKIWEL